MRWRWLGDSVVCALTLVLSPGLGHADFLLPGTLRSLDPAASFSAKYAVAPPELFAPAVPDPGGNATTTVGGYTFDVNGLVGATRYYDHATPIIGQNTITTNLEAGYFWNGHETLSHVATNGTNFVADAESWGGASVSAKYDRHATWAAMLIGGRQTAGGGIYQDGIAFGTDLRSAAIASKWLSPAYAVGFDLTVNSFLTPYQQTFGVADVVNSSYGFTDPDGTEALSVVMDAYSFQNPRTTYVASAGNNGPGSNTVGSPGSDYNAITVGALGNANAFNTVAGFSSRAPQDFGYITTSGSVATVSGVRSAVDISAPGESLVSAFYGGQNGGNNTTLANSTNSGTDSNVYSFGIAGTSFAAPIVAGGAALVASAAKTLPTLSGNPDATQSMVVKALLLNGADKTIGWTNGQATVTAGGTTYIGTTQSVDYAVGTGRMNLDKTFDMQVNGQTDVLGMATGSLGTVLKSGWDYGNAILGVNNDYVIADWLAGGTTLTTTLSWMRNRFFDYDILEYADVAQADLDLSVWALDGNDAFTTLIASSASDYNTVEHLSFTVPAWGRYGLRIAYGSNTFDNTGGQWGSASLPQDYGLAWTAVPEPATVALLAAGIVFGLGLRSRQRGPPPGPPPDDTG